MMESGLEDDRDVKPPSPTESGSSKDKRTFVPSSDDDDELEVLLCELPANLKPKVSDCSAVQVIDDTDEWRPKAHEAMRKAIEDNPTGRADSTGKRHDLTVVAKLSLIHEDGVEHRQAVAKYFGANVITNTQVSNYRRHENVLVEQYKINESSLRICDMVKKPSKYKPIWDNVYAAIADAVQRKEVMSRKRVHQMVRAEVANHIVSYDRIKMLIPQFLVRYGVMFCPPGFAQNLKGHDKTAAESGSPIIRHPIARPTKQQAALAESAVGTPSIAQAFAAVAAKKHRTEESQPAEPRT